eukprot:1088321_1
MSTVGSIYNEGANILHEDDDIVTEINKTPDGRPNKSMEMQNLKDHNIEKYDEQNDRNDTIQITFSRKNIKSVLTVTLWILVLYSAISCTYLLFANSPCSCPSSNIEDHLKSVTGHSHTQYPSASSKAPSSHPSKSPTSHPSKSPTNHPSKPPTSHPSKSPTSHPSKPPSSHPSKPPTRDPSKSPTSHPSSRVPTKYPTTSPTLSPSIEPTLSPTHYQGSYIGDFKLSFKNYSHGFWKKCDGSYLSIDGQYAPLFNEIGYVFGKYVDNVTNHSYFKLPEVADTVIGIAGSDHSIGDQLFGKETMLLTQDEIPPHRHYTMYNGLCATNDWGAYAAAQCTADSYQGTYNKYIIRG